jgi:Zn-dependent protease with chaperone function
VQLRQYFFAIALCSAAVTAAPPPAHVVDEELRAVFNNQDFLYEQRELPLNLRQLMAVVSVARTYTGDERNWYKVSKAIKQNVPISDSIFYVDPLFIPQTTMLIEGLSARMNMQAPLVCLADENELTEGAAVCALGAGQYCLVLSRPFLAAHTLQECEAILLHELAHIKQKHLRNQEKLEWIVPGCFVTGMLGYWWRWPKQAQQALKGLAALGFLSALCWVGNELLSAWWGRQCEHDADKQALHFFSGTPEQFVTTLHKARDYTNQLNTYFKEWYMERYQYVAATIADLPEAVPSRIIANLQGHLINEREEYERVWLAQESSIFDEDLTSQERINYLKAYLKSPKHKTRTNT